jgi:hypothetical protein
VARALLALLLLGAGAVHAREPDALAALDECAAQLDPSVDVGYERVAARCPGLTATLEHSAWAPWLPPGWKAPHNLLNAEGLRALHASLVRESAAAPGSLILHPQHVRSVLERIRQPEHAAEGWWARVKRWLRALFTPQPQADKGWLRRLLGDVSIDRAVLRLVAALSIALLVLLAVALVVNELRVAGLLRRRPGRATPRYTGRVAGGAAGLRDVDGAEPRAQPALLLELIAARLVAQERLPPARAFTVREVLRRVRLADAGARVRLGELAAVSERLRYDTSEVAAPVLAAAVLGGRELLAALQPAAGAGSA